MVKTQTGKANAKICLTTSKTKPHTILPLIEASLAVSQMARNNGVRNGGMKNGAFKGRPATFIQNIRLFHGLYGIRINDHQVCVVAFANKSAVFDLKKNGWIVAHFLYEGRYGEPPLTHHFHGRNQTMLYHGPPDGALK
jgi:hypothetical protein